MKGNTVKMSHKQGNQDSTGVCPWVDKSDSTADVGVVILPPVVENFSELETTAQDIV